MQGIEIAESARVESWAFSKNLLQRFGDEVVYSLLSVRH